MTTRNITALENQAVYSTPEIIHLFSALQLEGYGAMNLSLIVDLIQDRCEDISLVEDCECGLDH